ncbi:MAG: hypothetical protein HYY67_09005 [Thaumarchaeota archaeon]|nr:hypothetical protein [Nitrososphaerota archaeon]
MDWIKFEGKLGASTEIQVHYSKGDRIRQTALEYLAQNYIRMLVAKAKPVKKKRAPRLRKVTRIQPSPKDDKLDSYLAGASGRDKKKAGRASS